MTSTWRYGKRNKYRAKVSQDPEDYYRLDSKKSAAENAYDIYAALCCRETRDTKRLFLLNGLATLCHQKQQHQQQDPSQSSQQRQQLRSQLHATTVTRATSTTTTTAATAAAAATSESTPTISTTQATDMTTTSSSSSSSMAANNNLGFTTEELLYCLSASLIHTFTQVRAAALRTIRYTLHTANDIKIFNGLQLSHLLCRSIDLKLKNDDERVQALKLIRKMLIISPADINPCIVRCLVSLVDTGIEEGDNLLRVSLAILCEFGVLNSTLLICCGGVAALTRNVLECHNPRIAESLSGVLLYLLEWPRTRNICGVRLDCLAAPYCDFTYRLGIMDKNKDTRTLRYTSCRLALLSVLRSWTGTIEFCDPNKPSGLKAIIDALFLNQIEVRKAILELLYELLGLPQPTWTDDFTIALQAVDPSDFQDNWLLSNGFVASEGRSILPSLASRAPNICEQLLSLQLQCFLETGLLNSLVEVIVQNDITISVAATILLGKLLYLMHMHLPPDICSISPALPTLVTYATRGNRQASAAITVLQTYQKMLRNRPASSSIFLDSIIQQGALINTRLFKREINAQDLPAAANSQSPPKFTALGQNPVSIERVRLDSVSSSDESNSQTSSTRRSSFRLKCKFLPFLDNIKVNRLIKDSNVLSIQADGIGWDWDVINTILRSNLIRKMDDTTTKFLKTIIEYFKPSNNLFSHLELVPGESVPIYVTVGLNLIDCLLASHSLESMRLLTDLFSDIAQHLLAITTSNRAHDCLFSPQHMSNTMCQQYFLYIGRMCRVQKGISILTNTAVFEHLINLVRNTDHVCYIKLIISGLDYTLDSITRRVLENALTMAKARSGRYYATQFLMVLLRARIPTFEEWGIPMIIHQIKDRDRSVVLSAMEVLEEACHEKYYLEEVVSLWPNLKCLGDVGRLLMARYYSISRGLNHTKAKIKEEIEYWKNGYNKRYVLLVEADTHSSLTLHVRNEDGYYSRRNCNTRSIIIPPNIPAHLYGQLVQTTQGTTALRKFGDLPQLIDVISRSKCDDEQDCLDLKAAIWAISQASTHLNGIEYFLETNQRIYEKLVLLATKCEVYSVRACCFSALGVIGSTSSGANILLKLGWLSVRHDRNAIWPVHQSEDLMMDNIAPMRHLNEDISAYHCNVMEDQIDSSCYMGSYWNLLFSRDAMAASAGLEAHDANTTTDSIKTSNEEGLFKQTTATTAGITETILIAGRNANAGYGNIGLSIATKSKTLPEGSYPPQAKHQRSLSESKTTDVISLINSSSVNASTIGVINTPHVVGHHRIHYNSCTDSNTSGVSSCESVTGKVGNTADFQQFPLSPIPSMSNLMEIPINQSALMKRIGVMISPSFCLRNDLSPMDLKGYTKFRSLRKHCRPVLSESATELYDFVDRIQLCSFNSFRPRKSSFGSESQRKMKVRSLDRQTSLGMYERLDAEELQVPLPNLNTPKCLIINDSKGPCYKGVSLPKNLLDLFPRRNLLQTYVLQNIADHEIMDVNFLNAKQQQEQYQNQQQHHQFLSDILNIDCGDESSVISSLSDTSSASKRLPIKRTTSKNERSSCLNCARLRRSQRANSYRSCGGGSGDPMNSYVTPCDVYANASAILVTAGLQLTATLSRRISKNNNNGEEDTKQQQHLTSKNDDGQLKSPESVLSEESITDKVTASILYNVQRLANPVSAKQSKMALLELKQKHSTSFLDICLYSEVCKTLGRYSYRMNARRFLQELFLDLDFDSFYNEPLEIISKKEKELFCHKKKGEELGMATILSPKDSREHNHYYHHHHRQQHRVLSINGVSSTTSKTCDISSTKSKSVEPIPTNPLITTAVTTTTVTSLSSSNYITNPLLKSHLKSQHLASLYETSCENLYSDTSPSQQEQRQRFKNNINSNILLSCKNIIRMPPPPAAPPPVHQTNYNTELRITSDEDNNDEDDDNDNTDNCISTTTSRVLLHSYHPTEKYDYDEVDSGNAHITLCHSNTQNLTNIVAATEDPSSRNTSNNNSNYNSNNNKPTASHFTTSITTESSGNQVVTTTAENNHCNTSTISQQSVNIKNSNSNKLYTSTSASSSFTVSPHHHQRSTGIENENKKYTRGRFYTLELDLSCTKNKFPITDRGRIKSNEKTLINNNNSSISIPVTNVTMPTTISTVACGDILKISTTAVGTIGTVEATTTTTSLKNTSPFQTTTLTKTPLAELNHQQQQIVITSTASSRNLVGINATKAIAATAAAKKSYTDSSLYHPIPTTTIDNTFSINDLSSNFTLTITKSLAASLAQPIGKLYCEKRLQTSKSEALLSQENTSITISRVNVTAATTETTATVSVAAIQTKAINVCGNTSCGGSSGFVGHVGYTTTTNSRLTATTTPTNVFGASKQS